MGFTASVLVTSAELVAPVTLPPGAPGAPSFRFTGFLATGAYAGAGGSFGASGSPPPPPFTTLEITSDKGLGPVTEVVTVGPPGVGPDVPPGFRALLVAV